MYKAFKAELPARLDAVTTEATRLPLRLWVLDELRNALFR